MSEFAKGINSKIQRARTKKYFKKKKKHQVIYPLPSISCPTLELLAVTVFEILSFLCQILQREITKNV